MSTYAGKRSWLPDTGSSRLSFLESPCVSVTSGAKLNTLIDPSHISHDVCKQGTHPKRPRLRQTTIDLGSGGRKICSKCGMQFMPASVQDVRAHEKYCARIDETLIGIRVPRKDIECCRMVRDLPSRKASSGTEGCSATISDKESNIRDCVLEVTRRSTSKARTLAARVLRAVERELGSVNLDESKVWSMVEDPSLSYRQGMETKKHDAFKAYLYVANGRCVGFCLTQRIWKARKVTRSCVVGLDDAKSRHIQGIVGKDSFTVDSSSYCADGTVVDTVTLGISRIWVAPRARGKGIAKELLGVAQDWFLAGRTVSKSEIAFSQPTESGLRLARKWHGVENGWCVYDEHNETS